MPSNQKEVQELVNKANDLVLMYKMVPGLRRWSSFRKLVGELDSAAKAVAPRGKVKTATKKKPKKPMVVGAATAASNAESSSTQDH